MAGARERLNARPWLLAVGLRSRWDVYSTGLRGRRGYYVAVASLVVGFAGIPITPLALGPGLVITVAGVGLSVGSFALESAALRRGNVEVEKVDRFRVGPLEVEETQQLVHHPTLRSEVAVVDYEVDKRLLTTKAKFDWNSVPVPILREAAKFSVDVLRERTAGHHAVFNGALIRQDHDLTADILRSDGEVQLSKTTYFSLICTNYMTESRVLDRDTNVVLQDGRSLIKDRSNHLRSLSESRLANPVGVSTLGITADHRMVLIRQAARAQSSANLYAPAGSGSMDFQDRRYASKAGVRKWRDLVEHAMRRELAEECAIDLREGLDDTEVLGYFRWLNKGAKPEYVGITKLAGTSDDFRNRPVRRVEQRWVRHIVVERVDFELLREEPDRLDCLRREVRGATSVPLYMALRRLGQCLGEDDAVADRVRHWVGLDDA
jgi:hypothetical protein